MRVTQTLPSTDSAAQHYIHSYAMVLKFDSVIGKKVVKEIYLKLY